MYRLEDAYWWYVGRRRLVKALVQRHAESRLRILDVGCGTGGTLEALADLGSVVGADISAEALSFCRQRGHMALAKCRIEALPFAQGAFDVVVCCDILEHVADDEAGLREVLRVLRPGGMVVITVPAYRWLWSEHDEALSHLRRYERGMLRRKLAAVGARLVRLSYAVSFVFPVVLVYRLLSRLRLRPLGPPHTQLMRVPGWVNALLTWLLDVENRLLMRLSLPFGTSLVAVATKPPASGTEAKGQA